MRALLRIASTFAALALYMLSELDHIFFFGYPVFAVFFHLRFRSSGYLPDFSSEAFFLFHFCFWFVGVIAIMLLWEDRGANGARDKFLAVQDRLAPRIFPHLLVGKKISQGTLSLPCNEGGALSCSESSGALSQKESQ